MRQLRRFQRRWVWLLLACGLIACKSKQSGSTQKTTSAASPEKIAAASPAGSNDSVDHDSHDCSVAHPGIPAPKRLALTPHMRERLTTLRISDRNSSVILRKHGEQWVVGGRSGCTVHPDLIRWALDNLESLTATPSDRRLTSETAFELSIAAEAGADRLLHLDIAHHEGGADLVQLANTSVHWLRNLDRQLLSPKVTYWCSEP